MPENSILSIRRCFEIFELFDQEQRPLSASEIARGIEAPLSSVIDLLKSISATGYITYDSRGRTFFPTIRIGFLGRWLETSLLGDAALTIVLDQLRAATNETICVSAINDLDMQYLLVLPGMHAISLQAEAGQLSPIFSSAVGGALMARWTDTEVKNFVKRYNTRRNPKPSVDEAATLAKVVGIRKRGYAVAYGTVDESVGAVARAIPLALDRNLVISIGGPLERIRANEADLATTLVKILRKYKP